MATARRHYRMRWKPERRHALIVSLCVFAVIGGLITIVSVERLNATSDLSTERIGTIIVQRDPYQCEQMKFDNATGRTVERFAPCRDKLIPDAQNAPPPLAGDSHLEALRKSFYGR